MIVVWWRWTPPPGVSLYEHAKMLPAMMIAAYVKAGSVGCFVVSCEVSAILDTQFDVFKAEKVVPGPIGRIGRIGRIGTLRDIPVWVNLDNMENEVLVAEDPVDPFPLAKLVIDDLVDTTVLDRLAKL